MRLSWFVLCAVLVLQGCSSKPAVKDSTMERGWITRAVLLEKPEHQVFKDTYDTVQVMPQFVQMAGQLKDDVSVLVFLGTWCPDSKREVPRFLKVADGAGIPADRIKLYAVDRTKKSDDGMTDRYHIERVPTFIFQKNNEEIGRITETPELTIEQDMVTILARGQSSR